MTGSRVVVVLVLVGCRGVRGGATLRLGWGQNRCGHLRPLHGVVAVNIVIYVICDWCDSWWGVVVVGGGGVVVIIVPY